MVTTCTRTCAPRQRVQRSPPRAAGLALVEGLVVLVVFLVGLLGVAALYTEGVLEAQGAAARARAAELASDMVERMRANRAGAAAYADTVSGSGHLSDACRVGAAGCAPPVMASTDKAEWTLEIAAALPSGRGSVAAVTGSTTLYTIRISWLEPGVGPQAYVVSVRT